MGDCAEPADEKEAKIIDKYLSDETRDTLEQLKTSDLSGIENLVFEGGGAKCTAYVGGLMVLESLGVMSKVKRVAGTSGGAILATLIATGHSLPEVLELIGLNYCSLVRDSNILMCFPNMITKYGWHPAQKLNEVLKIAIEKKTGNGEITFWQLYKKTGRELCIVSCNITTMSTEYFHAKTTPHVPVLTALQSSMAIPVLIQPVCIEIGGLKQYFVDGGLLCNFPIHAFDGWYLSMSAEDSFLQNVPEKRKPFDSYNEKTIGMTVYSYNEPEVGKVYFEKRYGGRMTERPQTRLLKERMETCEVMCKKSKARMELLEAAETFLKLLREADLDRSGTISLTEFKSITKDKIPKEVIGLLFGEDFKLEDIFAKLDKDGDGSVTFDEFVSHVQACGVDPKALTQGSNICEITSLVEFCTVLCDTMTNNTGRCAAMERDIKRTIGINTDYLQTVDFDMEEEDKTFLIKQGILAMLCFFK